MNTVKTIAIVLVCGLALSGCNRSIFDTYWDFNEALVKSGNNSWESVKVEAWRDYENSDMIQIVTPEKVILTHSANIMLIKTRH